MKHQFEKLRCCYLGDCWFHQASCKTISTSSILVMRTFPFADIVHIIVGSMMGELTHELNVSLRGDDPHSLCIACSSGNMRGDMATTTTYFPYFEVGHEFDDDIDPLYVYGHVFDFVFLIHSSIYYSVVGVIFSVQCLPLIFYSCGG